MASNFQKLVIVHTNDIHSRFDRMPKIASAIDAIRRERDPSEIVVIDCGDHMDRMRPETEGSQGQANVAVLNATGYDAVVLGNNEGLTLTPRMLSETYRNARFAVIGSNIRERPDDRVPAWMRPFWIATKGRLKIGAIGVTAPYTDFYKLLGWDVLDPFETVARLAKRIRPHVDVLIVASHLGLAHDKRLAEQIDGIDVIIGGHTHHLLEQPLRIGECYIAAAGYFGQHVGELEFEYDFDEKTLRLVSGRCVETEQFEDSERIARIVGEHREIAAERLRQPVADLPERLDIRWDRESPFGNLLAAGVRRWVGAEVGIVNAGQILHGLGPGVVTKANLLEACPSPINPCVIRLSGDNIRLALEQSLLGEFTGKPIRGFGFRGKVLGTLCLDGIEVEYDPEGDAYRKIRSVRVNGQPLRPDRRYTVGTIDMFTFGIGYRTLGEGEDAQYFLPEFIRDVLERQLQDPAEMRRSKTARWIAR